MKYTIPENSNAVPADHVHFKQMNDRVDLFDTDCGHLLTKISDKYKDATDKGPTTTCWRKHCYTEFYGPLLEHLTDRPINLLEIGVRWGGSILMWRDFFPKAEIYGVDIDLKQTTVNVDVDRVKLFQGNACGPDFPKVFGGTKFDVIINDAHHRVDHQTAYFNMYRHHLNKGGYLICEDFHTLQQARQVIEGFKGRINNMSLIDRTHCIPSTKGEIIVMYKGE